MIGALLYLFVPQGALILVGRLKHLCADNELASPRQNPLDCGEVLCLGYQILTSLQYLCNMFAIGLQYYLLNNTVHVE